MKIVIVVALLALAGCKNERSQPDPAPTGDPDTVELLTPGSEPTRLLRYRLAKGSTSGLEYTMEVDLDGGGRGGKMPGLLMSLTIYVEDVLADGSAKVKTTVDKARVLEREGATIPVVAVANMTQMLTGLSYTATLTPDGTLRDVKIVSSQAQTMAKELGQTLQGLEQVAMAMPRVPVGVGAKWSSRKQTTQNGVAMTTVTTFEITALDGDTVSFASTSTISAPDQTIQEAGVSATIKDIGGGGTSKGTVDLSKMTMTGEFSQEFRGTMVAQGSAASLRVAMKMTMK
jgi:hypothetical protein